VVLDGLLIADEPATWSDLGFALRDDALSLGGVHMRLAGRAAGDGILGWHVSGLESTALPAVERLPEGPAEHPNGVIRVDHVVAVAGDFARAVARLEEDGLAPRRVREVPGGPTRQAFYVLGTALLELVGPVEGETSARLWGLTLVAQDLDAVAGRLGDRLGEIRAAVQPGRRIATLRRNAGSSVPLAFMTPR
jgi:hypothetical protein